MIESVGTLIWQLAAESFIASVVLLIVATLAIRIYHVEDSKWQSRFCLLPVVLPVPIVLLIHLLIRPRLLGPSHTPLEQALSSAGEASPWVPLIALGFVAVAMLSGGVRTLKLIVTLRHQRKEWYHQQRQQSPLWLRYNSLLHAVARKLQMPPAKVILVDGRASGSIALGPLGSYILVSRDLAQLLDDEEMEGLLAHELAHIKRRDTMVDALMGLTRPFLSLNPFAHWAYRRFMKDREEMADKLAVLASGNSLALASCLVKACRVSQDDIRAATSNALLSSTTTVEHRIRRLIDFSASTYKPAQSHTRVFFGTIVLVVILFLFTL